MYTVLYIKYLNKAGKIKILYILFFSCLVFKILNVFHRDGTPC